MDRVAPNIKLIELSQTQTPSFEIPNLSNNSVDFNVAIQTDQNIT